MTEHDLSFVINKSKCFGIKNMKNKDPQEINLARQRYYLLETNLLQKTENSRPIFDLVLPKSKVFIPY